MKTVFSSHSELAHVWAQQIQSEGRAGNMFFRGGKIYSYGGHFCIARILPSGVVVFGTHTYSSSTGKHQSLARGAVSHRVMVHCHDPDESAFSNRSSAERRIENKLDASVAPRIREVTRLARRQEAESLARQFNTYLEHLPADERKGVEPLTAPCLTFAEEQRMRELALAQEKRTKQQCEERERKERLAYAEKLQLWRKHEYSGYLGYLGYSGAALRLSKGGTEVQTSRGAAIPVSHAKRLWPIVQNVRTVGLPLHNRNIKLGHYTLTHINGDGSIVVGCHNIAYDEIERIAKQLGLLEEVHS